MAEAPAIIALRTRATNELVAAKSDEDRATIIARLRRAKPELADELAGKFGLNPTP